MFSLTLGFTSKTATSSATTNDLPSDLPADPSLSSKLALSGEPCLATEDSSGTVDERDDSAQPTDETPSATPSASDIQRYTTVASVDSTSLNVTKPHHRRISIRSGLSLVRPSIGYHEQKLMSGSVHALGYFNTRARTTMSNLPCELLDHIVDLLHDSQIQLRSCCLVSKSWIPRTRRHLFAEVDFKTSKSLESWKKTFPDPSISPARYVKTLFIRCPQVVTAAGAEADCWTGSFPRVVRLVIDGREQLSRNWADTLALFHGISPMVRSLRVNHLIFPQAPQLIDLMFSFPLLEDLSVTDCGYLQIWLKGGSRELSVRPSSLSAFAGSLSLDITGGMEPIAHRLLALSGGMHCRKLTLKFSYKKSVPLLMKLVEKCSHTLESLDITYENPLCDLGSAFFNLSKATKLRDVVFRFESANVEWITLALRDITSKHRDLRRISVDVPHYSAYFTTSKDPWAPIGERSFEQWLSLDRILVHLWESLSIHTNVRWTEGRRKGCVRDYYRFLLPEMTKRGMVTIDLLG